MTFVQFSPVIIVDIETGNVFCKESDTVEMYCTGGEMNVCHDNAAGFWHWLQSAAMNFDEKEKAAQ